MNQYKRATGSYPREYDWNALPEERSLPPGFCMMKADAAISRNGLDKKFKFVLGVALTSHRTNFPGTEVDSRHPLARTPTDNPN
jgi:hypothetical protein